MLQYTEGVRNEPGHWDFMISYTQRNDRAMALAWKLRAALLLRGKTVWVDVEMRNQDVAAMEEAAKHSQPAIAHP